MHMMIVGVQKYILRTMNRLEAILNSILVFRFWMLLEELLDIDILW